MSFWAKSGMVRVYGWYFLYCYDYWSIYSVLIDFVFPKHGSFLFLWVGEICYFDILSNCEQKPACHILRHQLNKKCSCTFIIINNYMYLHFKLSLQFLDPLHVSIFLCKKNQLSFDPNFISAPKKVKKKYTKSLSLLDLNFSIFSLCAP